MVDDDGTVREIAWREVFPWLILVRVFRIAIQLRMLMLSTVAVLATIFGWWLLGQLFRGAEETQLQQWIISYSMCPWTTGERGIDPPVRLPDWRSLGNIATPLGSPELGPPELGRTPDDPFYSPWQQLSAPVRQLFNRELTITSLAFVLLCVLWAVLVWSLLAGGMTRMAVVQLAREENVSMGNALRHARSRWRSYFSAPMLPLLGVLLPAIVMALLGALMRLDFGIFLAGIFWPLMLLVGLLMTVLLIGLTFGYPLMFATISAEGTDSFDALSRSYSYVFQRPLHYLFYAAVATLLGMLGLLLVAYVANAIWHLAIWALLWGSGNEAMGAALMNAPDLRTTGHWGANLLDFWGGVMRLLVLGFVYSYFWAASSAIYLLLRYHVDGTEMDEVYLEDAAEPYALPPLEEAPTVTTPEGT